MSLVCTSSLPSFQIAWKSPQGNPRALAYIWPYQVLTCLMMATKLASSQPLSAKDVASLSKKSLSTVLELEAELLQSLDFDIVIPHYMGELISNVDLSRDSIVRVEFLCQLMMLHSYRIFFDRERINAMIRIVEGEEEGI